MSCGTQSKAATQKALHVISPLIYLDFGVLLASGSSNDLLYINLDAGALDLARIGVPQRPDTPTDLACWF